MRVGKDGGSKGCSSSSGAGGCERTVFAKILRGELPAEVLDDDGELFSFVDHRPASTLHYLVIPKRCIKDVRELQPADAPLVDAMERMARGLVRKALDDAFDEVELALGYHWPPFYSVPWLHLHAIYPRSAMVRAYKYTPITFKSPEWTRRRLQYVEAGVEPPFYEDWLTG